MLEDSCTKLWLIWYLHDSFTKKFFRMRKIVIFGSSSCTPDSAEYITAFELGRALALCAISVVTGGYSGTMEAVSSGASQVGGVKAS